MKKIDIHKVAALCIRNKKLLVVKSRKHPIFITLGGKKEPGESDLECLERECLEEVGCRTVNPKFFAIFTGKSFDRAKIVEMACYLCELDGKIVPQSEIEECAWVDSSNQLDGSGMLSQFIIPALIKAGLIS